MYEMKLVRPLVVNVKEFNSSIHTPMYFYQVSAIKESPDDPEVGMVVTSNGVAYTTDETAENLATRLYECTEEALKKREKAKIENGQKKSSAVALYLILAGRAVIDERGDLVDESEYPHGLRIHKNALVGTAPLYPTISATFDPAKLSGQVSNSIKRDARNMMMSNEEFHRCNIESMSKEREEEIEKWIESDSPVQITHSEKDQASLQEIGRGDDSFLRMAEELKENPPFVQIKHPLE